MDEHQFAILIEAIDNCKCEIVKKLERAPPGSSNLSLNSNIISGNPYLQHL